MLTSNLLSLHDIKVIDIKGIDIKVLGPRWCLLGFDYMIIPHLMALITPSIVTYKLVVAVLTL